MDEFGFLNPDDFRRWMKKQDDEEDNQQGNMIGAGVEARHRGKRTARSITLESGRAGKVVREFVRDGGIVRAVEGDEYLIEVPSGSFYINKKNVIC
jgi:hypothetical protein